jgi:hypothetical protein
VSATLARVLRDLVRVLSVVGVCALLVGVRVSFESAAAFEAGALAERAGEVDAALAHYRRAARWYAPLSPYPPRALDALAATAGAAERAGDRALALRAWRSVHASIRAARSVYDPFADRLSVADARIALLVAEEEPPPIEAGQSRAARARAYEAALAAPPGPEQGYALLALVGFFGWVLTGFAFGRHAVDREDRFVRPVALRLTGIWALFFACFWVGLALA